jgi:hypothetical protein
MRTIPLHGKTAAGRVALVDDEDYALVMAYRWCVKQRERGPGRTADGPYAQTDIRRDDGRMTTTKMHNLILGCKGIDHRNGDGLDNQRANLRVATRSQNAANQGPRAGTSQYKGVSWNRRDQKWHAQICHNRYVRCLGYFTSEEDAAHAYDVAAREAFGPFARLNFEENP